MSFIQFLIDTPAVAFMLLLALLVTVVPIIAGLLSCKKSGKSDEGSTPMKEPQTTRFNMGSAPVKVPPTTRFLGTQMDIAILIFGLFLLLGVIGWVKKTFFG